MQTEGTGGLRLDTGNIAELLDLDQGPCSCGALVPPPIFIMYPSRLLTSAPRTAALSMGMRKHSAVSALTTVKTGNEGEIGAMGITPSAQTRLKQGVQGK